MADRSPLPVRNPLRNGDNRFRLDVSHWPVLAKYALALALTSASLVLRWLLDPLLGNRVPVAVVIPVVVFLAVFVGPGPAVLAALGALLGAIYFFVLPHNSPAIHDTGSAILIGFYLLICGAIIATGEAIRRRSDALMASEERFRAFVSASSDVVYSMSPDWKEMRYLQGREFIEDTHQAEREWLEKYIHPEDQATVLTAIQQAIASKGIFELEHRVLRADGSLGWTHSRAVPLFDPKGDIVQWFGTASDVTSRRQAEEVLRQSRERSLS